MNLWRALLRLLPGQNHKDEYELLPENSHHDSRPRGRRRPHGCFRFFTLRRIMILLAMIPVFLMVGVLLSGVPPTYNDIRTYEAKLPQNNVSDLSTADSRTYLRFPGHLWGHGLNNVLQEAIVMGYLAHLAGRVYVFEDYTWSHLPLPYTIYDFALRSTRIPLNAFVAGPLAGGPLPAPAENAVQKRAVSAAFYEKACPRSAVHVVSSVGAPTEAEGSALVEWWVKRLSDVHGARCVEVDSSEQPVFDRYLFGSPRLLSLLPGLNASPILGAFAWSPLVHSAVTPPRSTRLHGPSPSPPTQKSPTRSARSTGSSPCTSGGATTSGTARGSHSGARGYMGVNTHPALPDRFVIPTNTTPEATEAHYLQHCLPSPSQLAARLHAVRADHQARHPGSAPLSRVYILTNAWGWFVNSVRAELVKDGWTEVWGSGDIALDSAQAGVGMAVDMRIGEGAEVFLGNGFSSLTSNIVMLRLARGLEPASNRFL
ncbi:hypothetical protein MVEN_00340300 [Mycena venus]|uniref:Uncharacterized protein n=1 Tax=Mycena venus TaxID=2733690 RepID=A0A8H7D7Y4_9AGAR|nr:hypothetical protein MVEN_00340300 [Mycena venus]